MHSELIWVYLGPALAGMVTMAICGHLAKSWLSTNTGYQPSRAAAALLGPIITSFVPVRSYTKIRAQRREPTTLATVFWIATGVMGTRVDRFLCLARGQRKLIAGAPREESVSGDQFP